MRRGHLATMHPLPPSFSLSPEDAVGCGLVPPPIELHFRDENGWANGKSNPRHSQYAVDEGVLDAYRDGIEM